MTDYNELALARARQGLQDYCLQHNRTRSGRFLAVEVRRPCLVLLSVDQQTRKTLPQLKFCLEGDAWQVFWFRKDACWEPYPGLPRTSDWRCILNELGNAPLHVHWSS